MTLAKMSSLLDLNAKGKPNDLIDIGEKNRRPKKETEERMKERKKKRMKTHLIC